MSMSTEELASKIRRRIDALHITDDRETREVSLGYLRRDVDALTSSQQERIAELEVALNVERTRNLSGSRALAVEASRVQVESLRAELESEREKQRWVLTTNNPPPSDRDVLLRTASGDAFVGRQRYGNLGEPSQDEHAYRAYCCGRFVHHVTGWMGLPKGNRR